MDREYSQLLNEDFYKKLSVLENDIRQALLFGTNGYARALFISDAHDMLNILNDFKLGRVKTAYSKFCHLNSIQRELMPGFIKEIFANEKNYIC